LKPLLKAEKDQRKISMVESKVFLFFISWVTTLVKKYQPTAMNKSKPKPEGVYQQITN